LLAALFKKDLRNNLQCHLTRLCKRCFK